MTLPQRHEETAGGFTEWITRLLPSWPEVLGAEVLRVEELDEDDTHVVRVEIPGIDPEHDLDIEVEPGRLTIRAERTAEERDETAHGYRSEFRYGSFTRTLPLPSTATPEDVTATYHDGILEVRSPLGGRDGARRVPVTTG